MESSGGNAFEQHVQDPQAENDPFGENGQGDFEQQDPFAADVEAEPRVVDREGKEVTQDAPTAEVPAPDPTGAAESAAAPDPATTASAAPASTTTPEPEPEPATEPAKKGDDTRRRYLIFSVDGPGKYSEVSWHEDKKGQIVPRGTPGAKKQSECLVRGQEDALAVGFAAVGSPQEGCTLVAVAASYFRVRHVSPEPILPRHQKLQIK